MTTLVLIPGLMNDEWVWSFVRPALEARLPVHVPHLLGHDSLVQMASMILAETKGPLAVAGHSMGGRVAMEMMRQAPGRIERLALLDTGYHGPAEGERQGRLDLVALGRAEGMAAVVREWLPPMVSPRHHGDAAIMEGIAAMLCRASPEDFARQQHALLTRLDAGSVLEAIRCPAWVIVGREDSWSPVAQHEEMAARIPGAVLRVVEEAGHMLPVEQPEALARILLEWLDA